jgi:phosphate:Na+ symporter
MGPFDVLTLLCGLALFLYGMEIMGDGLKKSAGNRLKSFLGKATSNPFKGFLLGLGVTAIVQSSSATTVMVVGFVNSGIMSLTQSIGVTFGAEIGTVVTNWLTGLSELGSDATSAVGWTKWLTPDGWMPILAVIGICVYLFSSRTKHKDLASVLLGFAVLMVGMDLMSMAVSPLKQSDEFKNILTMFNNPLLGLLAGLVLTAIIQSSSASVGILQTLASTGAITWGMAFPILLGQNIGTCATALIASTGANKDAKRAALIHLLNNVIGGVIWLTVFWIVSSVVTIPILSAPIGMLAIAGLNTAYKTVNVATLMPCTKLLEKLTRLIIKDKADDKEASILNEHLFATPAAAVESANRATVMMAETSASALLSSLDMIVNYDPKTADAIRAAESRADKWEDDLGSYLVKLSGHSTSEGDSYEITKLLHLIGDFERISDHAVNLLESAEEMRDKKLAFSQMAQKELSVLTAAVRETVSLTMDAFTKKDMAAAALVEPLEQVIDDLKDKIKVNHTLRLQKSECTIEHGFVLSDMLNNLERVSDHCSNVAGLLLEMEKAKSLDMHKYLDGVKHSDDAFRGKYEEYREKYAL